MVLADGLAPSVTRWAEGQERRILREGSPLDSASLEFARSLGIREPETVRVLRIGRIPLPVPEFWVRLGRRLGLPIFSPGGMALGRGIYLLHGQDHSLRHELVHVAQYERLGGISRFMRLYLRECLEDGYAAAGLEREACLRSVL